jgi:hypothetical protein
LLGSARGRAVDDRLLRVDLGQADAAGLVQPLELAVVVVVALGAQPRWRTKRCRRGRQEPAPPGLRG